MSEQDAVELAQQELALARMGDEMDMANWVIDYADALIQALEASQQALENRTSENERLRTYAQLLEGEAIRRSSHRPKYTISYLRNILGLNDMAEWIIPDNHRAALDEQETQDEQEAQGEQ